MSASPDRPLALVTGASSGIGRELAKQFATDGYDLIMNAEDGELFDAAREVEALGARVQAVQIDLARSGAVRELYARVAAERRPLAAAALNAGIGVGGAFATDTDLDQELHLIDLNVRSTVHLAKLVLGDMVARDEGRILLTSSIAAAQPDAYHAVHDASKSFVQSFGLALSDELRDTGVTVTLLMPGSIDTGSSNATERPR